MWSVFLLLLLAHAQQPDVEEASLAADGVDPMAEDTGQPYAEIVVYGDLVVAQRRGELNQSIRSLGYKQKRRRDGRTVYASETPWRPDIVVDDEGYYTVKRASVRLDWPDLPGAWGRPPVGALVCVVAPTSCIKVGGMLVSPAKLNPAKRRVHEGIADEAERWREAVVDRAMRERLDQEIPDLLTNLWEEGRGPGGQILESHVARRAALLDFWATRTDYPEGRLARDMTALFLEMEVQVSPWPVTAEEQEEANERCGCLPRLALVDEEPPLDKASSPP